MHDPAAWFLLDCLVDFCCDDHGIDPLHWDCDAVTPFLLDWVPRNLSGCDEVLARMPEVLRDWVPWAARRAGLPAAVAAVAVETISAIEGEFVRALADERRWGPAKQLAMRMVAAGVDPNDPVAANTWLATQITARQPA
ncbi:MAG: hypothetical protein ACRD0U_05985 [Acidimicrobiales bacterium]